MNKIKILIILLLFIVQFSNAQTPNWTVNPAAYSYNMTMTGVAFVDYEEIADENSMIGAFINGECRGIANPQYNSTADRYLVFLMIYSNTSNDSISFKVYNSVSGETRDIEKKEVFEINGIVGNITNPYIWSNPTLSSEAFFLTYSLPDELAPATIDNFEISVAIPFNIDPKSLIAEYTTSDYATVSIDDSVQTSGVTSNDFENPLIYRIVSADFSDTNFYTVTITRINNEPYDITLSDTVIFDTMAVGDMVGSFTTSDPDISDTFTYDLVSGDGDEDNYVFKIEEDNLYIDSYVDYFYQKEFSIRVRTTDNNGGEYEKIFNLIVEFATEPTKLDAKSIISPNNDNYLDTWEILNPDLYSNCDFKIVNSNGEIVFQSTGYDIPWDGTYNGKTLPIGAYYYIIKNANGFVLTGNISLIK